MKSLKFIQIGDIHYPQNKEKTSFDLKDEDFPEKISNSVRPNEILRVVVQKVRSLCDQVDGIFINGDLTSWGNLDEYSKCVSFLEKSLNLSRFEKNNLHVVAGNHDVNREKIPTDDDTLLKKFSSLDNEWKLRNLDIFCSKYKRETKTNSSQIKAAIYSVNSCLGCGELIHIPERFRSIYMKLKARILKSDKDFIYNKLDTPSIDNNSISELKESIENLDDSLIPIIVTHHNILPQSIVRIDAYTELINSGRIRSILSNLNRAVLYCHGHIHSDTVEIIYSGKNRSHPLVCISAPELVKGFNVIEVCFSDTGLPLGCIINRYCYNPECDIEVLEPIRVPLSNLDSLDSILNDRGKEVINMIDGSHFRFNEYYSVIADNYRPKPHQKTVAKILLEAEWLGLIEIYDRDKGYSKWSIRRVY